LEGNVDGYLPVRFITVFVRSALADARLTGGARKLAATLGGVEEAGLIRWICMSEGDVRLIERRLMRLGLAEEPASHSPAIAVVDMVRGPRAPCPWLESAIWTDGSLRVRLKPRSSEEQATAEGVIRWVHAKGWVCPMPIPWNELWKLINFGENERAPMPLVLAAWGSTSDEAKARRLGEQLVWAEARQRLAAAEAFLSALKITDWRKADDL
jgi:hypothetical protein